MRPSPAALIRASRALRAGGHHIPPWGERPYGVVYHPEPRRLHVYWGKAIGTLMFTFIFWRMYEDQGVLYGWKKPWEAHPPHHHDHDDHSEAGHH